MNGYVEGTIHSTFVKKKGPARDRRKCIYYHDNGLCGSVSKCTGSAHCSLYMTEKQYKRKHRNLD